MIKRIPLLFDAHLTEEGGTKAYRLVKKFLKGTKWDEIVIGGDFGDFNSLSHWMQDKRQNRQLEGKRYKKECDVINEELNFFTKRTKKLTYLFGNHEDWIRQYIDKHPQVEGILDLPTMLHFKKRKINYIPYNELYKIGKVYLTHGYYTNKYHAEKHMRTLGTNIIYGHNHSHQIYTQNMKMQDPYMSMGIGCLCGHSPDYLKGKPANWIDQFCMLEVNSKTGRFNAYPINITDGQFIWKGKEYK